MFIVHAIKDVTDKNSACSVPAFVIPILAVFIRCLVTQRSGVSFLKRTITAYLPNFIEIGRTVSRPGRVEKLRTSIYRQTDRSGQKY